MKRVGLILVAVLLSLSAFSQEAVGEWQSCNSFVSAHHVCAVSDRVYAATRMAMFYYDKDDYSTSSLTKGHGLSDMGVSTIAYDNSTKCLLVAYTNSSFDIKRGSSIDHVADIKYSNISGDKKIYHIRFHNGKAYLATGFGIVVVNLNRAEIEETYYLGTNGATSVVYDVAFTDSTIVAAIDDGLLQAPIGSNRLHISDTWVLDTLSPLAGMSVRILDINDGKLVAAACTDNPDSLTAYYQLADGSWNSWGKSHIESLRCHNGYVVLNHRSSIDVYSSEYQQLASVSQLPEYGIFAFDVDIDADGTLWMGHPWAGIVRIPGDYSVGYAYRPSGPYNDDYVYSISATDDKVYLCPGGKLPTFENTGLEGRISVLNKKEWSQISRGDVDKEYYDILNVAVDPRDSKHISATAWGYGVLDIQNGVIQDLYNETNTDGALTPYALDDFVHLRVSGLAYDDQGNLWVTNSLVNNGLAVRYRDGEWSSFNISAMLSGLINEKREIDKIVWDSVYGYKWFAGRANRIFVHDGDSKMAYVNPNNGSKLETHSVTCLVQDRSGDIWFGTDKGLKVIYDGYRAFSNGGHGEQSPVNCSNILFSEDGIYEYLMAYESITCIAVDGANRKWVGTSNNGLYLISANGQQQIEHFTSANSPLGSDKIVALAVHPTTGVLYIGTNMGVQTYRTTATAADEYPSDDIHAFPNPVRPNYDGPIAIKGFTRDALVHITDARGHVVYSTTANGGQAIWDGRTLSGERVSSGAYFVFASDQQGSMRSVTKVLVIR